MKLRIITILTASLLSISVCATSYNTYHDQIITNKNICHLGTKMPSELAHKINRWLAKNEHIIDLALVIPDPLNLDTIRKKYAEEQQLFGTSNMSNYSFVVSVDNSTYVVRFSGIVHKARSILTSSFTNSGYPWKNFSEVDFSQINSSINTYQTISQLAHYLLLKQAIKKFNLTHIHAAQTYLAHIPGKPTTCSDDNYVIVQRVIPDIVKVSNATHKKDIFSSFSQEVLRELYIAITHAMLWDIEGNLFVDAQDYTQIYLFDFEQPNNSKSHLFFYQDNWKRWWDAKTGLEGINNLLKENGTHEQKEYWQSLLHEFMNLEPK